jgi:predicted ATPase with chaperone activity
MNDYLYQLTDGGRERARRAMEHCTYFGAVPVCLADYVAGVRAQSLTRQQPTQPDLERAFRDLVVPPEMLARLGPALCSGRGMFLYGCPGNGKSCIAERVTRAFGQHVWIPRSLGIDGEIIRLFDPGIHEELPPPQQNHEVFDNTHIDQRWVRIRRPTVVVGGELTMANLDVAFSASTGICEAPLQLKSNCGTLVIDDFGRQRISMDELMNRWIVPLEKHHDFLSLPRGKRICVPFDQLIVFSTNLEPRELVDESFLRRIPYKIEIQDPSEAEFRLLIKRVCTALQITYRQEAVEHLIAKHYQAVNRPFRFCHARDLLQQVRNYCIFRRLPLEIKPQYFDFAVEIYFSVM